MPQHYQNTDYQTAFSGRLNRVRWPLGLASVLIAAFSLSGCFGGSSSGGNGSPDEDSDPNGNNGIAALTLAATPDIMAVHLDWSGADSVNVLFSTERDCDWDNYSVCQDGDIRMDVPGGSTTVVALEEGLDARRPWYFVVETEGARSDTQVARPLAPGAEGNVTHAVVHDDRLYLGGNFDGIGAATGAAVAFDAQTGELRGALPEVNDRVHAVAADGEGGWIIAGEFTSVGGYPRQGLARLRPDGTVVPDWAPEVLGGRTDAVAVDGGRVYLGGRFETVDGIDRDGMAAIDLASGELIDEWLPTKGGGHVRAIFAKDGDVYLGGSLRDVNGESYERIVRVDGVSGAVSPSWEWDELDRSVDFLDYMDGTLFIAPQGFRDDDGNRQYVMALDPETGNPLEGWSAPYIDEDVEALLAADGLIYVGVDRRDEPLRVVQADNGDRFDDWSFEVDDYVEALAWHDGVLFVAGGFEEINGQPWENLVAVDGRSGALIEGRVPVLDDRPGAMVSRNGIVMAGGRFQIAAMQPRENLAVLDADTGQLLDLGLGVDGTVRAMTKSDSRLYVGGNFDEATGHGDAPQARDRLAAFSLEDGSLDEQWQPPGPDTTPQTLLHVDSRVYVGGSGSFGVGSRDVLAALDATNGMVVDWGTSLESGDRVYALAAHDGLLYAAGNMDAGTGTEANLRVFSMSNGVEHTGWAKTLTVGVTSNWDVLASEEFVYARGEHGGVTAYHSQPASLMSGEEQAWAMPGGTPIALLKHNGGLYVGGNFSSLDGGAGGASVDRDNLALINLPEGTLNSWDVGADGWVKALVSLSDGSVFVAGRFDELGGGSDDDATGYVRPHIGVVDAESGEVIW